PRLILLACCLTLLAAAAWYLRGRDLALPTTRLDLLSAEIPIAAPSEPASAPDFAETSSAEADRSFDSLAQAVRSRDWGAAAACCSASFRAVDWSALKASAPERIQVGIERTSYAAALDPVVGVDGFLEGIRKRLDDWKEIEFVDLRFDRSD